MKLAIRLDDITADMDWDKFDRFKALLDTCQVCPLLGIVPQNEDPKLKKQPNRDNFWELIKEWRKKGWVMAQHGFNHLYVTNKGGMFPLNNFSEYAGLPEQEQFQKLQAGQNILKEHGITTDIFMAPAHAFDRNTLKCLKKLGFHYVTDGFDKAPFQREGLTFLPISYKRSQSIQPDRDGWTTLVFHVNEMKEEDFAYYEKLFAEHKNQLISYGKLMEQEAVKRSSVGNLKEFLLAKLKFWLVKGMSH
ncbi:MAG: DUF2334 domain-containing protein [Lachnospiraceae bacterium]|nr:DUF2334 domain-containing protein [Lachnospiraceae bacterium]